MLSTLLLLGVVPTHSTATQSSGTVTMPAGTGSLSAPPDSIVAIMRIPPLTPVGGDIPYGAPAWLRPFDPSDRTPYAFDVSNRIGVGVGIQDVLRITMSAIGVASGVQVDTASDRPPIITSDGHHVQLWFLVNSSMQSAPAFSNAGLQVAVSVLIDTNETPSRSYEQTAILTVRQQ